jgi:phosphonatase-like hydrolase
MTAEQYDPARASKIGLIVFDMAGTTVNDEDSVNRCLREALGAHGLEVTPEQVNAVMGIFKPDAIRILIGQSSKGDSLADRVDAIHEDFVARSVRFYREDPSVYEVEGAGRTFARLQAAGIKVALNTGFNRAITDVILDRLGWRRSPLVDATITSDEVARGRPHPDMIRALMAKFGIEDSSSVAKVGDTPADLGEGRAAGCGMVVGVTGGTHSAEQLEPHPHTHLIHSIVELPSLLGL